MSHLEFGEKRALRVTGRRLVQQEALPESVLAESLKQVLAGDHDGRPAWRHSSKTEPHLVFEVAKEGDKSAQAGFQQLIVHLHPPVADLLPNHGSKDQSGCGLGPWSYLARSAAHDIVKVLAQIFCHVRVGVEALLKRLPCESKPSLGGAAGNKGTREVWLAHRRDGALKVGIITQSLLKNCVAAMAQEQKRLRQERHASAHEEPQKILPANISPRWL
jgi:hypothetical protein